ncbi:MAG: phosphoribosylglycinamide formyltransferase [Tepidisphaeraceae bacterium]
MLTLTVLVSGSGTTLQNLLDLTERGELPARVARVIGSRDGLPAALRAAAKRVPYDVVSRKSFASMEEHSARIFALCDEVKTDLVVCAGWLTLLKVPPAYRNSVINVHPALLPAFGGKGMYGHHVHESVVQHGCKVSGCTVHFVDDEYDHGPIILQRTCPVLDDDTPDDLAARVQGEERIALPEVIRLIHARQITVTGRHVTVSR